MFSKSFLLFLLAAIALSACGTLEVRIKQIPSPDPGTFFRNFKVKSDTPGELRFTVDYIYSGDSGAVLFSAGCLRDTQHTPCVITRTDPYELSRAGSGTLAISLKLYGPDTMTTDQIYVAVDRKDGFGQVYYQTFDYVKHWTVVLPTPTAIPTDMPTLPPTFTPTPTNTPSPTEFIQVKMRFWDTWFSYDPFIWQAGGNPNVSFITHRQVLRCLIYEYGPTEPPQVDRAVVLGQVQYNVAETFQNGLHADWYMAVSGPKGPFKGRPTLIVEGSSDHWDMCLTDALIVLATLN